MAFLGFACGTPQLWCGKSLCLLLRKGTVTPFLTSFRYGAGVIYGNPVTLFIPRWRSSASPAVRHLIKKSRNNKHYGTIVSLYHPPGFPDYGFIAAMRVSLRREENQIGAFTIPRRLNTAFVFSS